MFDRPLDCLVPEHGAHNCRTVHPVTPETLPGVAARYGAGAWLAQTGFSGRPGETALLPGPDGVAAALLGVGDKPDPYDYAGLSGVLPPGHWRIEGDGLATDAAALGFCLGAYRFDGLLARDEPPGAAAAGGAQPEGAQPGGAMLLADASRPGAAEARAVWLARDLINMPANWLGPKQLAEAAAQVCSRFGAASAIIEGEALAQDYPAIAAVGRGSPRRPRVFCAEWDGPAGNADSPLICLVGKGVCFDTGGLDLKPSAAMLRMKKDMGGAAIMLGLATLVMQRGLPVRLRLRLGCVENSVSGEAMRPSDVIATRKGLTVEIGNTDAEGRLVLCDLLAEACEHAPSVLLDAATLTGAARVALGPDLPALFSNDDELAAALLQSGRGHSDPLWRLPLHDPYDQWLSSRVADLNNVSSKPMAGAVTAGLFLRRFVSKDVRWAHLDTYAWSDSGRPGRPEGGDAQGLRALFHGLLQILNL